MAELNWPSWKVATIGIAVIVSTVLITAFVVGNWSSQETVGPVTGTPQESAWQASKTRGTSAPRAVAQQAQDAARQAPPRPSAADIEACNQHAKSVTAGDTTKDVLTKAVIGGAIAGAGKGAAIGGIVGATAGTLYGLNEANKNDTRSVEAYRACMRQRGYTN